MSALLSAPFSRALAVLHIVWRNSAPTTPHQVSTGFRKLHPISAAECRSVSSVSLKYSNDASEDLSASNPVSTTALGMSSTSNRLITSSTPTVDHATYLKLHRLAALNPPPPGSEEEITLKRELNVLIDLMDVVKEVQLPSYADVEGETGRETMVRELLSGGMGEVEINEWQDASIEYESVKDIDMAERSNHHVESGARTGRELLKYAARRRGDYFAFRATPRDTRV